MKRLILALLLGAATGLSCKDAGTTFAFDAGSGSGGSADAGKNNDGGGGTGGGGAADSGGDTHAGADGAADSDNLTEEKP